MNVSFLLLYYSACNEMLMQGGVNFLVRKL